MDSFFVQYGVTWPCTQCHMIRYGLQCFLTGYCYQQPWCISDNVNEMNCRQRSHTSLHTNKTLCKLDQNLIFLPLTAVKRNTDIKLSCLESCKKTGFKVMAGQSSATLLICHRLAGAGGPLCVHYPNIFFHPAALILFLYNIMNTFSFCIYFFLNPPQLVRLCLFHFWFLMISAVYTQSCVGTPQLTCTPSFPASRCRCT